MLQRKHIQFLRVYEPVHAKFERFCEVRCYGEMTPEDLINETLMVAYEKFDQLQSKDAFLSFLCGISLRILANNKRKARPITMNGMPQEISTGESTDARADRHFLYEALAQLPREQQEALLLFEITGFKIREIAEIQQCKEDAVKQRLKRGRERLKEILTFESKHQTGKSHG